MNVKIYIQARISSKRLPGKVLMEIIPEITVVELIYKRLILNPKWQDHVKILTSVDKTDDELVNYLKKKNIPYFRGSLSNVLERFYTAAINDNADLIVRVTADCPLIDPYLVNDVIDLHLANFNEIAYCSNVRPRSFPDGVDVESFTMNVLKLAYQNAKDEFDLEHVTPYIYRNSKIKNIAYPINLSSIRATLDTAEDLVEIKNIFKNAQYDFQILFPAWIKNSKQAPSFYNQFFLRRVTLKDAKLIYDWQMSPGMRKHFRNNKLFSFQDHCKWLEEKLTFSSKSELYIACQDFQDVGFIRIDQNGNREWEVSILIDSQMQGKGIGKKSLGFLRELHPEKILVADVKKENIISNKVFESSGYEFKDGYFYNYPKAKNE